MLEDAEGLYDEILCCGDLVGYGACPNETVEWCAKHLKAVVRGNHDKVAVGIEGPEGYNPVATSSLAWTGGVLTGANRSYLMAMPRGPLAWESFWLMHGSPVDEDHYLIQECDAQGMDSYLPGAMSFFGHTHRQGGFQFIRKSVRTLGPVPQSRTESTLVVEATARYLINPGSVGQPRDADSRAAYCIYDAAEGTIRFRRASYDIEAAAKSILDAGLPEILARRLFLGK